MFVTEKKKEKLATAVDSFARPKVLFNKANPNRPTPHPPFTNNEVYERERSTWEQRNPRKVEIARVRDRKDREHLDRKRRAKYPVHFSEDKKDEFNDQTETRSEATRTTFTER
jgi:hypothetical protein